MSSQAPDTQASPAVRPAAALSIRLWEAAKAGNNRHWRESGFVHQVLHCPALPSDGTRFWCAGGPGGWQGFTHARVWLELNLWGGIRLHWLHGEPCQPVSCFAALRMQRRASSCACNLLQFLDPCSSCDHMWHRSSPWWCSTAGLACQLLQHTLGRDQADFCCLR